MNATSWAPSGSGVPRAGTFRSRSARVAVRQGGIGWLTRVAGVFLLVAGGGWGALAASSGMPSQEARFDFDRDGIEERLVPGANPGTPDAVQRWNAERGAWEKAGYELPEGVRVRSADGLDAGLRLVDLNGDGFLDVLFSNGQRYAIHLWNKDVKPHLGWTRGWSQFVKEGERRGASGEPPVLVGAEVRTENGEVWIERPGAPAQRVSAKGLIAFDIPPPQSPEDALKTLQVRDGFRVELVAAEPVVIDPVSFDWGPDGRFWVVEMRDYPVGIDGKGKPGGVVKVLEDRDGDGRFESATTFLDSLAYPSSLMPWRKGVLIAAAPDLFYAEDTDGDGRADRTEVILTGFVPGNQQHRFNGFEWGLDGWVYAANGDSGGKVRARGSALEVSISGRDLRFHPETGEFETVSVQTQYGRRRDDWGNWFGNNNPTWLWQVPVPEHYLRRNPKLAVKRIARILANYENSTRVFPVSPVQVRPNQPWSLNHVTSGCSPSPYRDDLFGPDFATSVFICEPVHNVVHREVLVSDGSVFSSHRANGEETSEFLASTDNWFRPVTVRTGPDGALYIADMYRFVLEHPEWISPEMQARLDLRAGEDRGRIYRVVPTGAVRRTVPDLAKLRGRALVEAMDRANGWQRDMVQRLVLERRDPEAPSALKSLLGLAHAPQVRVQALATLGLLGALNREDLERALSDPHPWVRVQALRQSEQSVVLGDALFASVAALGRDGDPAVRMQAAYSLGAWPAERAEPILRELAANDASDEWIRTAVLSSLRPEGALFRELNRKDAVPKPAPVLAGLKPSSPDREAVMAGYAGLEEGGGDPGRGQSLFEALCATCHRLKGLGHEVGPDLAMVSTKPVEWLLAAILDPGAVVEARYRGWSVRLKSGDELEGLVAGETANNVVLKQAGGVEHALLRTDLEALEPLKGSLMPGGFETVLPRQGMADLIRWMRSP
jgi:putative membrane-bound dehydrogenase-like protein